MSKESVENTEYIHVDDLGQIKISDQVMAVCAVNATLQVKGVAGLTGGLTDSLQENLLGRESMTKGVKIDQTDEGINVDIYVAVYYGVKIPAVAWDIQNRVKHELETMTERTVHEVNIHVQSVVPPKAPKR